MKSAARYRPALGAFALCALVATSAFGQVTSRFVVPGGAATSTKATPGGSFAMDFRIDAPATPTIGASFLLRQAVPAAPSGFFQITARDFTASIYNDTASGTGDVVVLALPSALLNPDNDDNLGRNTIGLVGAATGNNLFVEKITFSVDPATPFGTYTIKPTSGGSSAVTDTTFNDYDMALTASFDVVIGQTLTVTKSGTGTGTVTSAPAGINCGATCSDIYPGTLVTLTAAASPGSTFIGWSGSGCSGTGTCAVTVSVARTVNAQFDLNPQTLTVTPAGAGTGTVTSVPAGINCGATCSAAFPGGSSVTLTAVAGGTSVFGGWSGAGCSGTGTCTVTMNSAQNVTATFNQQSFNLAVSKSGTGTGTVTSAPAGITCGATCTAPFVSGTVVTLTASPSVGSTFIGWSGGGCSGTGTCVVTVSAATTVNAQFDLVPQTLTVIPAGAGTGTVTSVPAGINCGATCSFAFPAGTSVTLTATPAAGSTFGGWSGGAPACSGIGTCTVTMNSAQNVTATFNVVPPAIASAVSRKVHGAAGTFDLPLSLAPTTPTTEPRVSTTATVVLTFNVPIISANAAVTEGTATAGALTFVGNDVVVPLVNVTDRQYTTITLTNVASASATGGTAAVRIGFLVGDVSQNGVVTVSDLAQVNTQLSQVATASNYLKDVNASGTISVADKGLTNGNLSQALPPP